MTLGAAHLADDAQLNNSAVGTPARSVVAAEVPRPVHAARIHEAARRWLEPPMLVLSLAFLVVLVWPLADPHISGHVRSGLNAADYGIWAAFAVEYVVLVTTAPDKRRYVLRHIPDLLMVALPMLRPLRVLRVIRVGVVAVSVGRRSREQLLTRAPLYAAATTSLVVVSCAAMVLRVERTAAGANIRHFGDAVWWAATTVTTVGYGDHYPVTGAGRAVAVVLMLTGMALLGVITASLAAWLVGLTRDRTREATLDQVMAELRLLRQEINARSGVGET